MMKAGFLPMLLLGSIFVLTGLPAPGQQPPQGYWMQHFNDENGLPQNSVKALSGDRNGFIWLTTEAGLVRFDGRRFVTFERSVLPMSTNRLRGFVPAVADGAKHQQYLFYAITEKNEYMGVLPNGLVSVDTTFYDRYRKRNPFVSSTIRHNSILAGLPAQYHIDPFYEHYFFTADGRTSYIWQNDQVTCFRDGKQLYSSKGPFKNVMLLNAKPYGVDSGGNFKKIGEVTQSALIGGDIVANSHYSSRKTSPRLFWNNISRQAFLYLNKCFYSLTPTANGNLTTRLILKGFDFENLNFVTAFFDEPHGFLFLGSITKGLFVFKKENFETHKLASEDADNVYYAQLPVSGRSVFTSQGYWITSGNDGMGAVAKRISPFMERLGNKFIMAQERDSTFWSGVGFDLYKLDRFGQKILASVKLPEKAKSLYIEPGGRLWIGCEDHSIYTLEKSEGKYLPRKMVTLNAKGILIMQREDAETMFVGTEGGLYRLNTRTGAFRTVKPFEKMTVRSFHMTREGAWVTTYGNGIYLLRQDRAIHFPLDSDRFLATAHCIVEDRNGFFWINTNHGLFQVAKRELLNFADGKIDFVYYQYYDKRHGFLSNEFNGGCQPCAVRLSDGTVSFPSMDGLVWFKPERIEPELPDNSIFVSAIQEDTIGLQVKDSLQISRDFEQLRLTVTTPYLGNEKNVRMHYKLSGTGREENWIPVNPDLIIAITNVPYGDYVLKIRKVNGFNPGDYTYKSLYLHVHRAWYETWWFRALAIALIAGLFMVSVRFRSAYHIRKEREANLIRHYRVISQIIAAVNHDIQTPLHYISFSLKQFNTYVHRQTDVDPLIVVMSDETLNTSQRLNTLTRNLLDYIKLQSKSPSARRQIGPVNVAELVSSVTELFTAIAAQREVRIKTMIDPAVTVQSDASLLSIIVHNLIDNALKVSRYQINISAVAEAGQTRIVIEDDGGGIPADQMMWLNKNYKSYEEWLYASRNPAQKGIGLVIVKDLCVLLGIDIEVSLPGEKKTMIVLTFTGKS